MNLMFILSLIKMALHKKNEGNKREKQQRIKAEF